MWCTFHAPGFLLGLFSPGFSPLSALLGVVALSVLITWMFNNTGGSVVVGCLMHLSFNFATSVTGVADSPLLYGLTVAFTVTRSGTGILLQDMRCVSAA